MRCTVADKNTFPHDREERVMNDIGKYDIPEINRQTLRAYFAHRTLDHIDPKILLFQVINILSLRGKVLQKYLTRLEMQIPLSFSFCWQ